MTVFVPTKSALRKRRYGKGHRVQKTALLGDVALEKLPAPLDTTCPLALFLK
jgi:hypothetical protein